MPVNYTRLQERLDEKKDRFAAFARKVHDEFQQLAAVMPAVFSKTHDEIIRALDEIKASGACVGAEPTLEYNEGLFIEFPLQFSTLKESMAWAAGFLEHKIVVATDGSQVYPTRDFSLPFGVVQVSCFRNEHAVRTYKKWLEVDVLPPGDLVHEDEKSKSMEISDAPVNAARFMLEINVLAAQMKEIHGRVPPPPHAIFIADNTLVLSYTGTLVETVRKAYKEALHACMDQSKATGYPVIGYVDTSAAKDVRDMVMALHAGTPAAPGMASDAIMLERHHEAKTGRPMKPGDRTCTFLCDRNDPVYQLSFKRAGYPVAFFYIKLNDQRMARVEIPAWVIDQPGLVDVVAKTLLAESIAGAGYPYVVDQCHHACVIHAEDREKILRLFQSFASRHGFGLAISNKARSKRRRS